jgi:hypothetical protein
MTIRVWNAETGIEAREPLGATPTVSLLLHAPPMVFTLSQVPTISRSDYGILGIS